jgi:hypothetical protein
MDQPGTHNCQLLPHPVISQTGNSMIGMVIGLAGATGAPDELRALSVGQAHSGSANVGMGLKESAQ